MFPLPLDSGHIGDKVSLASFTVALDDRVAGKSVAVTICFTPSAGGRLVAGSRILLVAPPAFFAAASTPQFQAGVLIDSTVTRSDGLLDIQLAGGGVMEASQSVCVTVKGVVMGPVYSGNATGISMLTSQVSCSTACSNAALVSRCL